MKKNKKPFSFEDFEKGLMLAGYISPINSAEINERKSLNESEQTKAKEKQIVYFKRVVLAAEIVNQLHCERTFGRVKFQKLVYLCENICDMGLNKRYSKFAAGPFDNKFMHSIDKEFKRQKWFDKSYRTDGEYRVPVYYKLENIEKYKGYYQKFYCDFNDSIQRLIEAFRKQKTKEVELVATIFACVLEISEKKSSVSKADLINSIYAWAKDKQKFSKMEILDTYKWMVANEIIPNKKEK